jgi:hypothetical protein
VEKESVPGSMRKFEVPIPGGDLIPDLRLFPVDLAIDPEEALSRLAQ